MTPSPLPVFVFAMVVLGTACLDARAATRPSDAVDDSAVVPVKLRVLPASLRLDDARDEQGVVVLAEYASGVVREVTEKATFETGGLAVFERGALRGTRAGKGALRVTLGSLHAVATLEVREPSVGRAISFTHDVLPTLTRAGCNAGSCHGAASGKNGFALSLFGYDPERDFAEMTRALRGRRIDLLEPHKSLVLTKPTTGVAHKGGKRLVMDQRDYRVLLDWITNGVPSDLESAPALVDLEILPRDLVVEGFDRRVRLVVRAKYADGTDRDVTQLALLSSRDTTVVAIEQATLPTGPGRPTLVTKAKGESFVLARFGSLAVGTTVLVHDPSTRGFEWPKSITASDSLVDRHLDDRLRKMRLAPAPQCSDDVFVRRVHVDLLGLLPTVEETRAFLVDDDPQKRSQLIDRLVARKEFVEYLALEWSEALRIEATQLDEKGVRVFDEWLRDSFREKRRFDDVVRELLTATGPSFEVPPANLFVVERDPKLIAEHVAQAFLGVRLQCAQCHDHPFERWTMDDYYGFGAFFARVTSKRGEDFRERVVLTRSNGELAHKRTGRSAAPKFLGGAEPELARGVDRRVAFASWLTSPDNPWFAKNLANRLFARVFGRGLVEPVDDVRVSNPASHPALLDALARRLVELEYDIQAFVAELCKSRSYGAGALPIGAPESSFAGRAPRRLGAEVLFEAIADVTGVRERYRGTRRGARATEIPGNPRGAPRFLQLFGRPERTSACTCDRTREPTLAQILHLIHGPEIEAKIKSPRGRLQKLIQAKLSDEEIVENLFLAAYARRPSEPEMARMTASIDEKTGPARRARFEDLLWALLNSKAFLFQR